MLICRDLCPGIQECELNLAALYPSEHDRTRFERKWVEFLPSDPDNARIFTRTDNDTLTYLTESLIPTLQDDRPPLLLLLGNPASHSVASCMAFAFEGEGREHRFWRVLRKTGILDFNLNDEMCQQDRECLNQEMKKRVFSLKYDSPFRIGIAVYFSMPSAASAPKWSGVAGLQRLLGSKALREIALAEQERIALMLQSFMPGRGSIVAFQKNAYERLRGVEDPVYAIAKAKEGQLTGHCKFNTSIRLIGCPPTRMLYSTAYQELLARFKAVALQDS